MRIALVSPYSWTYPGGVTRHIEALADQFQDAGHLVRIFAPHDPDDRLGRALHRRARPQLRPADPRVVSLGRTVGLAANGAVSNVALTPFAVATLRHHLRHGGFDVIHVHEPIVPIAPWDALGCTEAALVGTFHSYSANALTNGLGNLVGARRRMNRLHVRIAVSEAAAWTGRRFFGGRYRVIPNGVELDPAADATVGEPDPPDRASVRDGGPDREAEPGAEAGLRIVFVGQAVERKGLPMLLRAYEAVREHVPATLTIVGAGAEEVAPLLLDDRGVRVLGKVSDADKRRELQRAEVLCAPSLGGESFGMVLTEAFAAGTPVVASRIAGYRDVVRPGIDGMLVPPGDATALAEALRGLALDPARRREMAHAAAGAAQRYAWPRVAERVLEAYKDARRVPRPQGVPARLAVRAGLAPADLEPRIRPRRLPPIDRPPARLGEPARAMIVARRIGHARERLPAVLGTLVSQTLLNLVALGILGAVMFSSVHLFDGHHDALLAATIGPVALAASVLLAPLLLPAAARAGNARLAAL